MTRSTGTSGLIFSASPPSACMALRMAARSTTAGTPVKSCISTRAGRNATSCSSLRFFSHFGHRKDVFLFHRAAVFVAQQIFQQHLHRERQTRNPLQAVLLSRGQAVINVGLAADLEGLLAFEAVERGHVRKSRYLAAPIPEARRYQATLLAGEGRSLRRGTGARTVPVYSLFKRAATWRAENSPMHRAAARRCINDASSF